MTSANRSTKIKVVEEGKTIKTISNASINFSQGLEQLKRMLEIAIRLSPKDPIYTVEKALVQLQDGSDVEIDQEKLVLVQKSLFRPDASSIISNTGKVSITVHVMKPIDAKTMALKRGAAKALRMEQLQKSKFENLLRENTPAVSNTPNTGTPSRPSSFRTRPIDPDSNRQPLTEVKSPSETPVKEEAPVVDTTPVTTSKPSSDTPQRSSRKSKGATPAAKPFYSRRDTQLNIDSMARRFIRQSIEQTWVDQGSPVPVNNQEEYPSPTESPSFRDKQGETFLSSFVYSSDEDEDGSSVDDDFQSCAGDLDPESTSPLHIPEIELPLTPAPASSETDKKEKGTKEGTSTPVPAEELKTPEQARQKTPKKTPKSNAAREIFKAGGISKTPISRRESIAQKPVFSTGLTMGEAAMNFRKSMRQNNEKRVGVSKPVSKKKQRASTQQYSSPMGKFSSVMLSEGRPSIGTITQQWEFMRTNFVNNSDEELEWLMVSKRNGAYKHAHRKHEAAEDMYFKALHDIEKFGSKLKHLVGPSAKVPPFLLELAQLCQTLLQCPKDEVALEKLSTVHQKLKDTIEAVTITNEAGQSKNEIISAFPSRSSKILRQLMDETDPCKVARKARELHSGLPSDISLMQRALSDANRAQEESLKNMEKWAKREVETDDYAAVLREEENKWKEKEMDENLVALETMRSFLPVHVSTMSIQEIFDAAKEKGGQFSLELATELKQNRFLHWLVAHPEDISNSNFLAGDSKQHFENLEGLDIVELRALSVCIPERFELDNDGRKAAWRVRFMARVKQLVSQQQRQMVKGMWSDSANGRKMVQLPPLKPELERRAVYFYRTKEQCEQRLKQYDDKNSLLLKKEKWLVKAEEEATEAKQEYDIVLAEMRDPDFVDLYGVDQLAGVKDLAKSEWQDAEKKRKTLASEVQRLKKTIEEAPISRENFLSMRDEIQKFLLEKGHEGWNEDGQSPIAIDGVFERQPVINRVERSAAKFVSAEQEAEQRKQELQMFKAKKEAETAEINNETSAEIKPEVVEGENINQICEEASEKRESPPETEDDNVKNIVLTPSKPNRIDTNSEFMNKLNNILTPGGKTPISKSLKKTPKGRRCSMFTFSSKKKDLFSGSADGEDTGTEKKEKKKSRSKLLKRMLEKRNSLSPIRSKDMAPSLGTVGKAPTLSFLDQLKAMKNKGKSGDGNEKPSFLNQIKGLSKKKINDTTDMENAENTCPNKTPEKSPMRSKSEKKGKNVAPQVNMLDAIKARRIE